MPHPRGVGSRRTASVCDNGFKRVIVMSGAYRCSKDYRKDDTSHGIGAVSMTFLLAGPKGAVQWHIGTDWYTRSTPLSQTEAVRREPTPRGWGIDYHSRTPMFAGQQSRGPYKYLDGADCYTDGTSLNAGQFMPDFLTHPGAVWDALRDDYNSRFNA